MSTRPLLVGEDNPYGSDPRYALYPEPENSAGGRLCRLVLGLTIKQYIGHFERVNLCSGKWSMPEARETVRRLKAERWTSQIPEFGSLEHSGAAATFQSDRIVLLGAKVCAAFGGDYRPFEVVRVSGCTFAILPHPSGRNRMWNEPGAFERARAVLTDAGVLPLPAKIPVVPRAEADIGDMVAAYCDNCHGPVEGRPRPYGSIVAGDGACASCGPR